MSDIHTAESGTLRRLLPAVFPPSAKIRSAAAPPNSHSDADDPGDIVEAAGGSTRIGIGVSGSISVSPSQSKELHPLRKFPTSTSWGWGLAPPRRRQTVDSRVTTQGLAPKAHTPVKVFVETDTDCSQAKETVPAAALWGPSCRWQKCPHSRGLLRATLRRDRGSPRAREDTAAELKSHVSTYFLFIIMASSSKPPTPA